MPNKSRNYNPDGTITEEFHGEVLSIKTKPDSTLVLMIAQLHSNQVLALICEKSDLLESLPSEHDLSSLSRSDLWTTILSELKGKIITILICHDPQKESWNWPIILGKSSQARPESVYVAQNGQDGALELF